MIEYRLLEVFQIVIKIWAVLINISLSYIKDFLHVMNDGRKQSYSNFIYFHCV